MEQLAEGQRLHQGDTAQGQPPREGAKASASTDAPEPRRLSPEQRQRRNRKRNVMQGKLIAGGAGVIAASGLLAIVLSRLLGAQDFFPAAMRPYALPAFVVLLSVVIAIALSFVLIRWLLRPVKEFTAATEQVMAGDYTVRVAELNKGGEFSDLQVSFNQMVEELEGTELLRKDFINDFSHEFKTPIVSIHGFAEQLMNEDLPAERRREYSEIIYEESRRLANLSSSILLLSKLENQQLITSCEPYELDEQLRQSVLSLASLWTAKALVIEPELEEVVVVANKDLMAEVWRNLLDNAIKFSPEGAAVEVLCGVVENSVQVRVSDYGPGMAPEVAARAFDKFYQGDSSHATQGSGIGLSVVKRAVELHQGRVWVESVLGQGCSVVVELPLV